MTALNIVSYVLLAIMALILGNTLAMGVRERTNEYGVLKAIGFEPRHILGFIVGEGFFTGLVGGLAGLLLSLPLLYGMAQVIHESSFSSFLPAFELQPSTAIIAVALTTALGGAAACVPAWRASRLQVTDALRRTE